ncbi:PREDICTED: uncharacterized protein LOC104803681 [Tarenaya hassleriana]|uniref:uncharacterized protein LOC104803681 n=1 Tax=Tarenaya hassleriana TaxID=28532 RepID=UPI00053C3569|nr:PREDICTED: uncharacterized protein LOC104803681 [Tarenaya hassleriana]
MARGGEWVGGRWSYGGGVTGGGFFSRKKITLLVCFLNILVALYVLRSRYVSSLHLYSNNEQVAKYTADETRKMEESIRIRRSKEPIELVRLVKKLNHEFSIEEPRIELSQPVKQRIVDQILHRLKSLDEKLNVTQQREAVENWRQEKLKEVKELSLGSEGTNSTILQEAGMLARALESEWDVLSEEIGLWLPAEVFNVEHDDKPEGETEPEEVLAGRPIPAQCNAELHTDYDGAAVRWGLTHHKESAAECCQACLDHAKRAKPGELRCNIWVYCPSEFGCYSPDIYEHKHQECWLKYAEKPKLNFKDRYSESYRNNHPKAPVIVPWVSGVVTA